MRILSEKPVSVYEGRKKLEARQKESALAYEQQNTLDYLQEFSVLKDSEADKLAKELHELGFLTEKQVVALVNLLPKKLDLVKAVLGSEGAEASEEQLKQILKIFKKYKASKE